MKKTAGILLLNKPAGVTSFQALSRVKKYFNTSKVGHAGTLDKFASGLLLVFVNEATRLVQFFVGMDKTYQALVSFGATTPSLDPETPISRLGRIPSEEDVLTLKNLFSGELTQRPPEYSALHIQGKRAYQRTLAGESFEIPLRTITVYENTLLNYSQPKAEFKISCSSGTYIRSIARDMGKVLNTFAYLSDLKRLQVGPFFLDQAYNYTDDTLEFMPVKEYVSALGKPVLHLKEEHKSYFLQGKVLKEEIFLNAEEIQDDRVSMPVLCENLLQGIVSKDSQGRFSYQAVFPKGI